MDQAPVNPERLHSSYAGRWVALVRGRVIAQGGTPEQALRASQSSRYKEKPEIIFMPLPFSFSPLIDKIKEQKKKYREENKEKIKGKKKKYYEENKNEIKEKTKQYISKNKKTLLALDNFQFL